MKYELRTINYADIKGKLSEINYHYAMELGIIEYDHDNLDSILKYMILAINCDMIDTENNYLVLLDKENGIILSK